MGVGLYQGMRCYDGKRRIDIGGGGGGGRYTRGSCYRSRARAETWIGICSGFRLYNSRLYRWISSSYAGFEYDVPKQRPDHPRPLPVLDPSTSPPIRLRGDPLPLDLLVRILDLSPAPLLLGLLHHPSWNLSARSDGSLDRTTSAGLAVRSIEPCDLRFSG